MTLLDRLNFALQPASPVVTVAHSDLQAVVEMVERLQIELESFKKKARERLNKIRMMSLSPAKDVRNAK